MQNVTEVRKCRHETIKKYKLAYHEVLGIRYILRLLIHLPEIAFIKHIIVHLIACVGHTWFLLRTRFPGRLTPFSLQQVFRHPSSKASLQHSALHVSHTGKNWWLSGLLIFQASLGPSCSALPMNYWPNTSDL